MSLSPTTRGLDPATTSLVRLYVVRAVVAVVWAAAFAAASSNLDAPAMVLLIVYPGVDAAASWYDARRTRSFGGIQVVNAAISTLALVGIGIATSAGTPAVLRVFGAWAAVSGLVQLVVALRRRVAYGRQWAMLVSGGLSTLAGLAFVVMAGADDPSLTGLAGYAGFGGLLFAVSALVIRGGASRSA